MPQAKLRWFILFGLLVFAIDYAVTTNADPRSIYISDKQLNDAIKIWQDQLDRKPTEDEFIGIVNEIIREEILYREALNLRLDKDDRIIKRRLAQKIQFLKESQDVPSMSTQQAEQYYTDNQQKYFVPSSLSFSHIFFTANKFAYTRATDALQLIGDKRSDATVKGIASDYFYLGKNFQNVSELEVEEDFSEAFYHNIQTLAPNLWSQPIKSYHGFHLVYVHNHNPGHYASFEQVESLVANDYFQEAQQRALDRFIEQAKENYSVIVNPNFCVLIGATR